MSKDKVLYRLRDENGQPADFLMTKKEVDHLIDLLNRKLDKKEMSEPENNSDFPFNPKLPF